MKITGQQPPEFHGVKGVQVKTTRKPQKEQVRYRVQVNLPLRLQLLL